MKKGYLILALAMLCNVLFGTEMREWTDIDGQQITGSFEQEMFGRIVIRDKRGETHQIPSEKLSLKDRLHLEYELSPDIEINVVVDSAEKPDLGFVEQIADDTTKLYSFEVSLKNKSGFLCKDHLMGVLYIIGEEKDGGNHVLVDRVISRFVFPAETEASYRFTVDHIVFRTFFCSWPEDGKPRGVTYNGYVVAVLNSKGELIASKTDVGADFIRSDLPHAIGKLRQLYFQGRGSMYSRHFDETIEKTDVPQIPWFKRSMHW